jgi:hypothetical protein
MFNKLVFLAIIALIFAFPSCEDTYDCADSHIWKIENNEHKMSCPICGASETLSFSDFFGTWCAEFQVNKIIDGTEQVVSGTVTLTIFNEKVRIISGNDWWELTINNIQAVALSEKNSQGYPRGFALYGTEESYKNWTWGSPLGFFMHVTNGTIVTSSTLNTVSTYWVFSKK